MGGQMILIIGVAMMAAGIAVVFAARRFPARRAVLERCGAYVFLGGIAVWGIAFAV